MAEKLTREQKIDQLMQRSPTVPFNIAAAIVDNIAEVRAEFEAQLESSSMKVNSVLGTMDPMYN